VKTPFIIVILFFIGFATRADVVIASTEGSSVAFTNNQSNFAWSPSALIFTRDQADTVSLSIYRHGQGQSVLLATISATASNLIWVPGNRYIFNTGSSLELVSSVTNFSIQLHREPVHE
jgi:hypothetical protein